MKFDYLILTDTPLKIITMVHTHNVYITSVGISGLDKLHIHIPRVQLFFFCDFPTAGKNAKLST